MSAEHMNCYTGAYMYLNHMIACRACIIVNILLLIVLEIVAKFTSGVRDLILKHRLVDTASQ